MTPAVQTSLLCTGVFGHHPLGWLHMLEQGLLAPPVISKPVVDLLCSQACLQSQTLLSENSTISFVNSWSVPTLPQKPS